MVKIPVNYTKNDWLRKDALSLAAKSLEAYKDGLPYVFILASSGAVAAHGGTVGA